MLDWDDLRYFLSIARNRTLAAAAKDLRVTQSTVGRRLASLDKSMGMRLFQRNADGFVLTLAGGAILAHALRVEHEALSLERTLQRQAAHVTGVVKVMGSQLVSTHLLACCFAELHARTPTIMIELHPMAPEDTSAARNVDVTVQLRAFQRDELVARRLGSVAFGLYASTHYLERRGVPDTEDGCTGHQIIALADERELSSQAAWLSDCGRRGDVVLRSDSYETQHRATVSGGGLAVLPRFKADAEPALRRLATHAAVPSADIWLGVQRDNRDVPRVRAVLDCVASAIRARVAGLDPASG